MVQKPNYLFCPCFALNEKVVGLAIVMQIQSSPHYNSETRYVSISIFHEDIPAPLGLKRNSTFFHHTTFLCVSLLKLRSCKITIALCRKKWFVAVLFFREARVTIINPHMGLDYNFFVGFGEEDYLRMKPRVYEIEERKLGDLCFHNWFASICNWLSKRPVGMEKNKSSHCRFGKTDNLCLVDLIYLYAWSIFGEEESQQKSASKPRRRHGTAESGFS